MTTQSTFEKWLFDPRNQRHRVTLVEITLTGVIYRMATQPYFTDDYAWDDLLTDDIIVESSIEHAITVGDFSFSDDYRTHWGVDNFYGVACDFYLGDTRWARSAFFKLAGLVIEAIQRVSDGIYKVSFTDKLPSLEEKAVGKLTGSQPMPIVYGSPRNVTPILIDYLTLTYCVADTAVASISAVRDRGKIPAKITKQLVPAKFLLGNAVAGAVTADVSVGITFLRDVIASLLTRAGVATTASSIEMRRFPAAYPNGYPVDVFVTDQPIYRELINSICEACGSSLTRRSDGGWRLTYLSFVGTPVISLGADDLFDLSETGRDPVYKVIQVRYSKNYTVQGASELAGGVPMTDVKKFGSEFYGELSATTAYSGALHDGTLAQDSMSGQVEAQAEAERQALRYATPRRHWRLDATQQAVTVEPGDIVAINDPALTANVLVVATAKNYTDLSTTLEVIA